jgi:hypothetical protein
MYCTVSEKRHYTGSSMVLHLVALCGTVPLVLCGTEYSSTR